MPLIEIDSGNDSFDRLIDRGVFKNNVRRFATEFESQFLLRPGYSLQNSFTHFRRSRERDLVDVRMIDNRLPGFARAGHDVDDAIGKFRLLQNFGEMHRGDACRFR